MMISLSGVGGNDIRDTFKVSRLTQGGRKSDEQKKWEEEHSPT